MRHKRTCGCTEYRSLERSPLSRDPMDVGLTRRQLLARSGILISASVATAGLPRVVLADEHSSERDIVVSLFLRGGADGLTLVPPTFESSYYDLRPGLAVPAPDSTDPQRAIDLDGQFALHPSLGALVPAWQDNQLAIVHACGLPGSTRSHFDAMNFLEVGQLSSEIASGWLGRHLATVPATGSSSHLRALALSVGLPRTLVGAPDAAPIPDPESYGFFALTPTGAPEPRLRAAIEEMYASAAEPLRSAAQTTFTTVDLLDSIDFASYQPASSRSYPTSELGQSLRASAAVIRSDIGVEALTIDTGGWDTHDEQGSNDGSLSALLLDLGDSLAAFHEDLRAANRNDVTLVVVTEFGRNVRENGSRGTDHGTGTVAFALGAGVQGGLVTDWPGIAPEQLHDGQDLATTTDIRDVLSELVTKRLGNPDVSQVFPDPMYTPADHGVFVARA